MYQDFVLYYHFQSIFPHSICLPSFPDFPYWVIGIHYFHGIIRGKRRIFSWDYHIFLFDKLTTNQVYSNQLISRH